METTRNLSKRILVVDDESDFRGLLAHHLEKAMPDVRVIEAQDGVEALAKVQRQRFDLVITDFNMPKANGRAFVEGLTSLDARQRPESVVVVSGFLSPFGAAQQLGALRFVQKPVDWTAMVEQVKHLLFPEKATEPTPPGGIDVALLNPFIDAAQKVVELLTKLKVEKAGIALRNDGHSSGDISAVVAIQGKTCTGSLAITFDEHAFMEIAGRILKEKFTQISPANQDAAGELCNQIFGMGKRYLNQLGHGIQPAIPSILVGTKHRIRHCVDGPCLAVTFKTAVGKFTIEAVVQKVACTSH